MCSPRGPSWMTLQRDKNTILCFDCKTGFRHTWNRQSELPGTHEWAACLVISFKGPTLPRMGFLNREKDKSCCQLLQYNLDSYMAALFYSIDTNSRICLFGVDCCLFKDTSLAGEGIGLWICVLHSSWNAVCCLQVTGPVMSPFQWGTTLSCVAQRQTDSALCLR